MNKKVLFAVLVTVLPASAMAVDNVGGCGVGSKLFDTQKGLAPQVLAVTTNGTFGNQTFGITSGTLGCTQDGVVKSNWKMAMFIDGNREQVARDMSSGSGESLEALTALIGVSDEHKPAFFRVTHENFSTIFRAEAGTEQVMAALREVLARDPELARYSTAI
jgi:hypothetical protein